MEDHWRLTYQRGLEVLTAYCRIIDLFQSVLKYAETRESSALTQNRVDPPSAFESIVASHNVFVSMGADADLRAFLTLARRGVYREPTSLHRRTRLVYVLSAAVALMPLPASLDHVVYDARRADQVFLNKLYTEYETARDACLTAFLDYTAAAVHFISLAEPVMGNEQNGGDVDRRSRKEEIFRRLRKGVPYKSCDSRNDKAVDGSVPIESVRLDRAMQQFWPGTVERSGADMPPIVVIDALGAPSRKIEFQLCQLGQRQRILESVHASLHLRIGTKKISIMIHPAIARDYSVEATVKLESEVFAKLISRAPPKSNEATNFELLPHPPFVPLTREPRLQNSTNVPPQDPRDEQHEEAPDDVDREDQENAQTAGPQARANDQPRVRYRDAIPNPVAGIPVFGSPIHVPQDVVCALFPLTQLPRHAFPVLAMVEPTNPALQDKIEDRPACFEVSYLLPGSRKRGRLPARKSEAATPVSKKTRFASREAR